MSPAQIKHKATPAPAPLQRALAAAASFRTFYIGRRLKRGNPAAAQVRTWRELIRQYARTEFGRREGIRSEMTYEEFRRQVPLRTYEQFAPDIERMKQGAASVLWPGPCSYYAVSSGTTAGRTKYLPITADMLRHFRKAGLDSLCLYARRTQHSGVFQGRHLFLGGSTSLSPIHAPGPFRAWTGDLSGITALHLPRWAERHLYEPGTEIAQIASWPEKLSAIAQRTAGVDLRLLAGIPSWLLVFAETMRAHTGRSTLKEIWPGLECLVHGGVPIAPFVQELKATLGPGVHFHEVYPASEGFIAAQDADASAGLRLFDDAGLFFEFLPMDAFEEEHLGQLGRQALRVDEVVAGRNYALVLTTPAGLCRYVIGDVVQFTSVEPPRLVYAGRTRLQLSAFGEHVIEKEATDALAAVCACHGATIANFHVAPQFIAPGEGRPRGRHEWWLEFRSAEADRLDPVALADALDVELQRRNEDYEAKRRGGGLDRPVVRLVQAGTFEHWLKSCGKWGGQHKMPRLRSDRMIADQLAHVRGSAQLHP